MGKKQLKRGFYWRGETIWCRDPVTGKRTSTRTHDPRAAELWRAERERLAADPGYAASLTASVGEWVVKTIRHKTAQRREGTVHMYTVKLGHVVRLFGKGAPLASITPGAVDDYVTSRRTEGAANNTIARELTCLRQMLRLAKRAGAFGGDLEQIMPVGFSAEYRPVTRTLRMEDFPVLWESLRNDQERAWVAFALATGADSGDVERAVPGDYDPVRQVVRIRGTKTHTRDAEVPVRPHMRELLEYAVARMPLSWPRASHGVGEACARAGLPHLSPKDLRRTAASLLVAEGAAISLVSRYLRHSSDTMVRKVYGQLRPEELGSLLEEQTGTRASQFHGPLGEIGIRRGFKRLRGPDDKPEHSANPGLNGGEKGSPGAASGTPASQEEGPRRSPAVWALAFAAERMGVLRG